MNVIKPPSKSFATRTLPTYTHDAFDDFKTNKEHILLVRLDSSNASSISSHQIYVSTSVYLHLSSSRHHPHSTNHTLHSSLTYTSTYTYTNLQPPTGNFPTYPNPSAQNSRGGTEGSSEKKTTDERLSRQMRRFSLSIFQRRRPRGKIWRCFLVNLGIW
jgi:hypothetical protein